jgi:Glycine zipper
LWQSLFNNSIDQSRLTFHLRPIMTKRFLILAVLVAFVTVDASAQNRTHRRRGALLGGLAGAAIGAAIGDKGNNETTGALIGGAIGAVAGGTIGDQKDRRIEHNQMYHSGHPQYVQPVPQTYAVYPPTYVQPAPNSVAPPFAQQPGPVSPDDVVAMARSGLSESMIIQQIQLNGVYRALSISEIIHLHQVGVSEPIIHAMQAAAVQQQPNYDHNSHGQPAFHGPVN